MVDFTCDRSSLFALRNQVNWRDVVTNADEKPAQCKRFLNLVLDGQIITAAMEFFGMKSMDDTPSRNGFPEEIKQGTSLVKQALLKIKHCQKVYHSIYHQRKCI